jgi:hypothetical protein
MMRFTQPTAPPAFTNRVNAIHAGTAKDDDIWGDHKATLRDAQHGRCGYCDAKVDGTGYDDVDHYRPKGRLDEINDAEAEEKCRRNIPPEVRTVSTAGYDWLRYEWTNYVFACEFCNRRFKRCLFPVEHGTRPTSLNSTTFSNEKLLLLWCYGRENPADHLVFTPIGEIAPKNNSAHGLATILTCGLSRAVLQGDRREKCEDAFAVANDILAAKFANDDEALADCIEECSRKGAANRPFAGVFRTIVTYELRMSWEMVLALRV